MANPIRTNSIFTNAKTAKAKANNFSSLSVLRVIICMKLEYSKILNTNVIIRTGNIIFFLLIKITVGL
jgi:hypothetical protein